MLPRSHRLTRADDFRRTIRGGLKSTQGSVIVYGLGAAGDRAGDPPQVGVTVSKAVGGSVVRHRVARVIRHAMAVHISQLPTGSAWVIRALPAAASSPSVADDVAAGVESIRQRMERSER